MFCQERALDLLGLELQMVARYHGGAGESSLGWEGETKDCRKLRNMEAGSPHYLVPIPVMETRSKE